MQAHWVGQNDTETLRHWIQYKFQGTIYSAVGDCLDLAMKLHYNAATNLDDIKQDLQSKNSAIIIYAYNHLNKPSIQILNKIVKEMIVTFIEEYNVFRTE